MEEVSTMMRPAVPGKSLTINGVGAIRESQQHREIASGLDVLSVQPGSTDRQHSGVGGNVGVPSQTVSILGIAPTSIQPPSETAGATVFVGASGTSAKSIGNSPSNWRRTTIAELQSVNGCETEQSRNRQSLQSQSRLSSATVLGQRHQQQHQQQQSQQSAHHVVKIRINPEDDTGRVISTVRLTADQDDIKNGVGPNSASARLPRDDKSYLGDNDIEANDRYRFKRDDVDTVNSRNNDNKRASGIDSCVRISVGHANDNDNVDRQPIKRENRQESTINSSNNRYSQKDEMVQHRVSSDSVNTTSINRNNACFYYGSFPNPIGTMTMSSGQCSPSDTLDSGTCSDLDGTPPPLPKKKNSSTVLLGGDRVEPTNGRISNNTGVGQHHRTGSLTSSGADVDSDDNESNISCDSLNSGELAARITDHTAIIVNDVNHVADSDEKIVNDRVEDVKGERDVPTMKIGKDIVKEHDKKIERSSDDDKFVDVKNGDDHGSNDNDNNNDIEAEDAMNVEMKNSGNEETNERNNGNVANGAETISSSCSTSVTSPIVSPSPSGASSLSKASSTPRVRSPVTALVNGRVASPVVKECTYEERKIEQDRLERENAAADYYANYNRKNGTKYLYDDDRFYKFHINEHQPNDDEDDNEVAGRDRESDEYFAGYKILDREAIRSAKGTVRGVKNRVRAGIATFLQKPSTKNYNAKDEGKIVVYTTSMSIVRETYFACIKMMQILKTHMVKYEVRDMFMSQELQTELKERIGCETIEVPQLFIDGQYIGNADAVEQLNESGELRRMFKPYKSLGACTTCVICGGCRLLPCFVCNGSKRSPRRYDFMTERHWLRCMNCDEVGLIRCQYC